MCQAFTCSTLQAAVPSRASTSPTPIPANESNSQEVSHLLLPRRCLIIQVWLIFSRPLM